MAPDVTASNQKSNEHQGASASPPIEGAASDLNVWHQKTSLSFAYVRPVTDDPAAWCCEGRTVLYVVDEAKSDNCFPCLHLKGNCVVTDVKVEAVAEKQSNETSGASLIQLPVQFFHADPLSHVLAKPPKSFADTEVTTGRCDADAQFHRGAVGMTTGLRAASIASNMGELRLFVSGYSGSSTLPREHVTAWWENDLSNTNVGSGGAEEKLTNQLSQRSCDRRKDRIALVAGRLADASCHKANDTNPSLPKPRRKALKLTIQYEIRLTDLESVHMGGIHFHANPVPLVYTTCGVMGDHEGPRSWVPCLDSASSQHRASHEIAVKVSAPMREGLSPTGCGEDFGAGSTLLHDLTGHQDAKEKLGHSHLELVKDFVQEMLNKRTGELHVIPSGDSVETIMATSIWCSAIWTPVPARSLGFTVGPLKELSDPEYYSSSGDDETLLDETEDQTLLVEEARANGEGIRQMYIAPLYERKYIHAKADSSLLPNIDIVLAPLARRHVEMSARIDQTIEANTSGVTNRALSLMRDILALPTYRTASYTQIWIPDAVHGGSTSGALHCCPEVLVNPFLGGAIMDSRLLPPVGGFRLPYYNGGRSLQFIQARCAVRGWLVAALPLGGHDDVGFGYIHTLFECFIMSLYDRAHGAQGEGGARGSVFFSNRYAVSSGLNSRNLDFLPVPNIEEEDLEVVVGGVVGAVPIEDRNNDQLWRSASNGSESHTSSMDEFALRQLLFNDTLDVFERGTDKDRTVPLPGFGWLGSHLSLSFLSSNSASSSALGCGALELVHPVGGLVYRTLKSEILRRVIEGRAGISNFIRVMRAAFVAAHIEDKGESELRMHKKKDETPKDGRDKPQAEDTVQHNLLPRFGLCVDEILKKHGLTHTLFTVVLRKLAGHREPHLRGTLVDVERNNIDARTNLRVVEPEGFPNSFVRGASELYLRVGTHVEPAGGPDGGVVSQSAASVAKRFQLHVYAEPVIPEGGIAFGGPVTLRVVENEGQNHFVVRALKSDGSRCDWGPINLHTTKPVTTARQQTAASGAIEGGNTQGKGEASRTDIRALGTSRGFNNSILHRGGYQAIELMRLTNRTPLLWVRADPQGLYGGRISVFQPDACLAEQLFHDGDAGAQVDAIRALAERPLRVQTSLKVSTVYDVDVNKLPVLILGDCLRGAPALHSSLPHTPAVRAQAALAIAQWQNNKAPISAGSLGADSWIGLNLLLQYFNERFMSNGVAVPVKFSRVVLKKNEEERIQSGLQAEGAGNSPSSDDDAYQYVDTITDESERAAALKSAESIEVEEDEEHRVRSAVLTAIASVRAKDGMTPPSVLRFLESVLLSENVSTAGNVLSPEEDGINRAKRRAVQVNDDDPSEVHTVSPFSADDVAGMSYVPSLLVADALLALCNVNVRPSVYVDPTTGKSVQSTAKHPVMPLMKVTRRWLDWELYRESVRMEEELEDATGIGGGCYAPVAASAIASLSSLAILRQSTMDPPSESTGSTPVSEEGSESSSTGNKRKAGHSSNVVEEATSQFYASVYNEEPRRSDVTRAACAQAVACICCAADRLEDESNEPLGLLSALEFLLEGILDNRNSPALRQTLALIMIDSCTGKVCSMQRSGTIGGRSDLCTSGARFMAGSLGVSHGGDNGSALLTTVSEMSHPAANAVNDGARRGLRLLTRAGHSHDADGRDHIVVRVAKFATLLWRTMNGDCPRESPDPMLEDLNGICSFDGTLRCTLLSLWQWIWPKGCFAVLRVQSWRSLEGTARANLGCELVLKTTDAEKAASQLEEASFADLNKMVTTEIDRQQWRGEMAMSAWRQYKAEKRGAPIAKETDVGHPLPPVQRNAAFKQGGWIASAAQQRRAMNMDGGSAVRKIRLTMNKSTG